jgi:hypothetical protein
LLVWAKAMPMGIAVWLDAVVLGLLGLLLLGELVCPQATINKQDINAAIAKLKICFICFMFFITDSEASNMNY